MYIIRLSMYDIYAYIYIHTYSRYDMYLHVCLCVFSFLNLTQNFQTCVPGMFFKKMVQSGGFLVEGKAKEKTEKKQNGETVNLGTWM